MQKKKYEIISNMNDDITEHCAICGSTVDLSSPLAIVERKTYNAICPKCAYINAPRQYGAYDTVYREIAELKDIISKYKDSMSSIADIVNNPTPTLPF